MANKSKEWLVKQKKDIQTLLICFVVAFVLYLIITMSFYNALEAGFGWMLFAAGAINAIRLWRKVFGIPTAEQYNNYELNKEERMIFDEILSIAKVREVVATKKIDEIIKQKISSLGYCKEEWQIHYSKERIKNAIKKQHQPSLRDCD